MEIFTDTPKWKMIADQTIKIRFLSSDFAYMNITAFESDVKSWWFHIEDCKKIKKSTENSKQKRKCSSLVAESYSYNYI